MAFLRLSGSEEMVIMCTKACNLVKYMVSRMHPGRMKLIIWTTLASTLTGGE